MYIWRKEERDHLREELDCGLLEEHAGILRLVVEPKIVLSKLTKSLIGC
jgi:hypothetical protein